MTDYQSIDSKLADRRLTKLQTTHWPAVMILLIYLVVGALYATYTPVWQIPDEPAHYNYVRSLAEGRGFPVMAPGDYDQVYLERLTSERFPPELSVDAVQYEDYQPPLYYLLATPIYLLFDGSVIVLRLFSLLLGGIGVVMMIQILREFLPKRPDIAWLGVGVIAFIPQFLAMMAGVNNDSLTVALLWLWLWLALRFLRGKTSPWILGGVLGALLLTKATGYGALALAVLVVFLRYRREGQTWRWGVQQLLSIFVPALVLGGIWWGHNVSVYGWPDVMGMIRHNEIVVGQPRTADWIARDGILPFFAGALRTTFRSFWGQFGWMGVVLDQRVYQGLTLFSALIVWGAAWRLDEAVRSGLELRQRDALLLLGTSAVITLSMFLWHNFTFVQHQGRYLFPALPLLALAAAFGLERLLERRLAVGTALLMFVLLIALSLVGLTRGDFPLWAMALVGIAIVALLSVAFIPERWRWILVVAVLVGLVALDVWCLFGFIVPMLT